MTSTYPGEKPESERFYRTVFTRDYNIGYELLKKDTCSTCGKLEMAVKESSEGDLVSAGLQEPL